MKATGIVRRIDDLGRVVIPKEIRRTMRIREGDPMEIYTDSEGEVIFKKYSPIGEIASFAFQYAEVLHKIGGMPAAVCDRDNIVSVAGVPKKELLDRKVSAELESLMTSRKSLPSSGQTREVRAADGVDRYVHVCFPIISQGDVSGAVLLISGDVEYHPSEIQVKLCQAAASLLGKQMEE